MPTYFNGSRGFRLQISTNSFCRAWKLVRVWSCKHFERSKWKRFLGKRDCFRPNVEWDQEQRELSQYLESKLGIDPQWHWRIFPEFDVCAICPNKLVGTEQLRAVPEFAVPRLGRQQYLNAVWKTVRINPQLGVFELREKPNRLPRDRFGWLPGYFEFPESTQQSLHRLVRRQQRRNPATFRWTFLRLPNNWLDNSVPKNRSSARTVHVPRRNTWIAQIELPLENNAFGPRNWDSAAPTVQRSE